MDFEGDDVLPKGLHFEEVHFTFKHPHYRQALVHMAKWHPRIEKSKAQGLPYGGLRLPLPGEPLGCHVLVDNFIPKECLILPFFVMIPKPKALVGVERS